MRSNPRTAETIDRHVDKTSGCWLWKGSLVGEGYKKGRGYAQISIEGNKNTSAHRLSYEIFKGPIPKGLTIDHTCRITRCVNPAHLEAVTLAENIRRGSNATKLFCVGGHLLAKPNIYPHQRWRVCKLCARDRATIFYYQKKRGGHNDNQRETFQK